MPRAVIIGVIDTPGQRAFKIFNEIDDFAQLLPVQVEIDRLSLLALVLVLELAGFGLGSVQRLLQVGAEKQVGRARALDLVAPGEFALEIRLQLGNGHANLLQQIRDEAVGLVDQGEHQMVAIHLLVRKPMGNALRLLQCFL